MWEIYLYNISKTFSCRGQKPSLRDTLHNLHLKVERLEAEEKIM